MHRRRDRVGGCPHDDFDAGLVHRIDHAVHPGLLEGAVLGLPKAPCRLADAHHAHAGILHPRDVLYQQLKGHVLSVVGRRLELWRICRLLSSAKSMDARTSATTSLNPAQDRPARSAAA